jgi:putative spermidine/putrescine transport system permease protein
MKKLAWALLAPATLVTAVTFLLPVGWLARLSFDRSESGGVLVEAFTLDNYQDVLLDPFYLAILGRSIWMSGLVTLCALIAGYPIALFLYRTTSRWRGLLAVLTVAPLLVSSVVRTFGWMVILGDGGWINGSLRALGLIEQPLRLMNSMTGVVIGLTEILMPTMILALIAGFARLDPTLEEAARSLGAAPWRAFLRVTLPLSLPGVVLGCLIDFVLAISSFTTPKLLGGGRVSVMATAIYEEALETLNWPRAAAIALVLIATFVVTLAIHGRVARLARAS